MFVARYRAIIDHLEQGIAILGAPDPKHSEITDSIRATIALLDAKITASTSKFWREEDADAKIIKLERHVETRQSE